MSQLQLVPLNLQSRTTDPTTPTLRAGDMYWNSTAGEIRVYTGAAWVVASFSANTQTLTNKTISGSSNTISNIGNASLTNSSVTVNGTAIALGASGTVTVPIATGVSGLGTGVATFLATPSSANLLASMTDETGSGLLVFGTSPTITTPTLTLSTTTSTTDGRIAWDNTNDQLVVGNGTTTMVISPDNKAATLTNKTISGASNTLTNIGNSSLTNSSITINGTAVALGGSTTVTGAPDYATPLMLGGM